MPTIFEAWDEAEKVTPTVNNAESQKSSENTSTKKKVEEVGPQPQKNSLVKNSKRLFVPLIIIYVLLIIVESLFFVPYNRIEIFRTEQNVPHMEVVGSGYASIFEIQDDYADIGNDWTQMGKVVDTTILITNITVTTLIMSSVYLVLGSTKNK